MASIFNYTISEDVISGKVDSDRLIQEIGLSAITIALDGVNVNGDALTVQFKADLPAADKTLLDGDTTNPCGGIIGNHSGLPLPDDVVSYVRACPTDNKNKHLFIKGVQFDAALNTDTNNDYALPEAMALQGALAEVKDFTDGDYVELFVLNGSDAVVGQYGETVYIPPSGKVGAVSEGSTSIPTGFKLRAKYHSVATEGTQPKITVAYRLWK